MVIAIHIAIKGRTRYKVEGLRRSIPLKRHLEEKLLGNSGISAVSVSSLTGNILVFYKSEQTPSDVALVIETFVIAFRKSAGFNQTKSVKRPERLKTLSGSRSLLPKKKLVPFKAVRKVRKLIIGSEEQEEKPWHCIEAESILNLFETSRIAGLDSLTCSERLRKYGPNLLPESVPRSWFGIFIHQFKSLPVAFLGIAASISLLTGGIGDAIAIIIVVLINAAIGSATEIGSERTIHSLKALVQPSALILRDTKVQQVNAENVVPGDILVLGPGSYVAADARLIQAQHLSIDESALTGESVPAIKVATQLNEVNLPLPDRQNIVYMGTLVTGGQGLAVVFGTGRFTEIGKIQSLVGETRPPETPMEKQLDRMGTQLVIISGSICAVVFIVGIIRGLGFIEMLKSSIALAVAAVPEGLPTVATTTLALGIRNMRKQHVLIRHLEAVETIGSIQTICLDKTGTITWNRMTVKEIYTGMKHVVVDDRTFLVGEESINPYNCDEFLKLLHVCILCNESVVFVKNGVHKFTGSPTENALINLAMKAGNDVARVREMFPLVKLMHRTEKQNMMFTLHHTGDPAKKLLAVKGNPYEVLSICSSYIKDGKNISINEDDRQTIELANNKMAGKSMRILGTAIAYVNNDFTLDDYEISPSDGFIWLGMVGMEDPIRDSAKDLISSFHQAGINTVMITGDQTSTAYAIGKELGLSNGNQLEILDSTHLVDVQPDVLRALCERVHIFSRVSPAHKLYIVQAMQQTGKVVAMTGDGINDGPALKAASIGIAMGRTGTDVAREVADIVLEDDNLETMIVALSQGRTIYNNIRKSLHFILSTNMSEIMVMFAALSLGLGQPLNAMQLLWINLLSDIFPGLALALEAPEPDVLSAPPRNPDEPIIKKSDFKRMAFESAGDIIKSCV